MTAQMPDFGDNGRLGNQIFQYFFMLVLRDHYKFDIRLPFPPQEWIFDFDTSLAQPFKGNAREIKLDRIHRLIDLDAIASFIQQEMAATGVVDLAGYFQQHTSIYAKHQHLFQQIFSLSPDRTNPIDTALHSALAEEGLRGNTALIAVHIRRGDYLNIINHPILWPVDISQYAIEVQRIKATGLQNAVVYIASDDVDYCKQMSSLFGGLPVITRDNLVLGNVSDTLVDFHIMSKANVLIASNSTFSLAAAMLNQTAKIMTRPIGPLSGFSAFDPWNTDVLVSVC